MTESNTAKTRYWVNIAALDHVHQGVTEGFLQASRVSTTKIDAPAKGDLVVFYSPRTRFRKGKLLQEFTAVGVVQDETSFPVEEGSPVRRRRVEYRTSTNASILPLVSKLAFIPDKDNWELPYGKGLFEIERDDFELISKAMRAGD